MLGRMDNLQGTGEQGKVGENIPVITQTLLGTMLIDQTVVVAGHHQLLVGTDLYTEGDHLVPLLRHFGANCFFTSDTALGGVAFVGTGQTLPLFLSSQRPRQGRVQGGLRIPHSISTETWS